MLLRNSWSYVCLLGRHPRNHPQGSSRIFVSKEFGMGARSSHTEPEEVRLEPKTGMIISGSLAESSVFLYMSV